MKYGLFLAFAFLLQTAATATATEPLSATRLERLGLSTLQVVPDAQAATVRGRGFASVGGFFRVSNGVVTQLVPGPTVVSPRFSSFGTFNPITNTNTPVMQVSPITVNGVAGTSKSFATGTVFVFGF